VAARATLELQLAEAATARDAQERERQGLERQLAEERGRSEHLQQERDDLVTARGELEERLSEEAAHKEKTAGLREVHAAVDPTPPPSPGPTPALFGRPASEDPEGEGEPLLAAKAAEHPPDEKQALHARIESLQAQNAALARKLEGRPIVYQFGAGDSAEEAEGDGPYADEAAGEGTAAQGQAGVAARCRQALRGARRLRKQKHVHRFEQGLRRLTRELLRRPLLLWLFYAQLIGLWIVEIQRHASPQRGPICTPAQMQQAAGAGAAAPPSGPHVGP